MPNGEHASYTTESAGSPKYLMLLTKLATDRIKHKEVTTAGIWTEQPNGKYYALHTIITKEDISE